jgi:hypothetical protein
MPHCTQKECRRWRPAPLVRYARIGLRVDGAWFCSAACVAVTAAARLRELRHADMAMPRTTIRLGALLIHQGAITAAELKEALATQAASGLRLGAELCRLGIADPPTVLRALATQAGVSYLTVIDPSCVRLAPAGLCNEEVRALGVAPLRTVEAEQVAIVACVAPVPYAALRALQALTGYKPVPYLVSEDDFELLAASYGGGALPSDASIHVSKVEGIHDAAQRIAAAASLDGNVRVAQARVEPFTLVRVAGRKGIDALLVTAGPQDDEEERRWLADTTRH